VSDNSALPAPGLALPSLLDIGSNPGSAPPGPVINGGLDSLLNGLDSVNYTAAPTTTQEVPSLTAYEKHGLKVLFTFPSPSPTTTNILLLANNLTSSPIQDFIFQAAVPKTMKISLEPPSSPTIPAGGQVTQQLQVINNNRAPLKMKLRLSFVAGGIPVNDQGEVANFPTALYS